MMVLSSEESFLSADQNENAKYKLNKNKKVLTFCKMFFDV